MITPAFYSGTGRRKTAIARVRLLPGEGEIVVNGRSLEEHFGNAVNETVVYAFMALFVINVIVTAIGIKMTAGHR